VVNQWMRDHDKRQGAAEPSFDAVIDVEAAVKDASDPAWSLRSDLTCDHVHPNQAGYQAIAAAIPLALFPRCPPRSSSRLRTKPVVDCGDAARRLLGQFSR